MKPFLDEEFLLFSRTAQRLYHEFAEGMPIIDYHCHLNPADIAENRRFTNITELWLGGDHYKWRAMRSNGINERYITGDAGDKEKFLKWAETLPACIGNPLYHWTHLELLRYFGINTLLSPESAEAIWSSCNNVLSRDDFGARDIIMRSGVVSLCTTDDPTDELQHHEILAQDTSFKVKVLPAFRPDKAINIEKEGFAEYIRRLSQAAAIDIDSFDSLKAALTKRMDYFHQRGCRISDHALDPVVFTKSSESEASKVLENVLAGKQASDNEIKQYKTQVMLFLGREYARRNWVMQLHMGTIRNTNSRMMRLLGPDTGFDAIGDYCYADALVRFLSALDESEELPKTILYCLNPRDNEVLGTITGCFQGSGIPGKIQFGSGWWFNDQKDGMIRQLTALSNLGLLSRFVGMLTDSRSLLSYTRHEYFRRILCNMLGEWVEAGEAPNDLKLLGKMVQDICYYNAERYFDLGVKAEPVQ